MNVRSRNWCSIVYPESAPFDWIEILENEHVQACVSPLHDSDVDGDNKPKKAHYHVILVFSSVKTKEQAQIVFNKVNAVDCQPVNDLRSYSRYLCHLDSLNKFKYDSSNVISLNGFDYFNVISSTADKYGSVREMIQFCKENNIIAFSDLMDYASNNRDDWFRCLCDNSAYVVKEYLKSASWKAGLSKSD